MDLIDYITIGVGILVASYSTYRLGLDRGIERERKRVTPIVNMVAPVIHAFHEEGPFHMALVSYEFDQDEDGDWQYTATVVATSSVAGEP